LKLSHFNRKWEDRLHLFRRHCPPPWWGPGLILSPEIRGNYNTWLPVSDYLHDLGRLAKTFLPHMSWCPRILRDPYYDGCCLTIPGPLSLPDMWAALPEAVAGHVVLRPPQVFPLLEGLANPPRYGTAPGRYPRQLDQVHQLASGRKDMQWRYCDLGCGTGEGTLEMTRLLHTVTGQRVHAIGVTMEPLEVHLALKRVAAVPDSHRPAFLAGDVVAPPCRTRFDLVSVNGLIGGPMLRQPTAMIDLFGMLVSLVAESGAVVMASNFHDGRDLSILPGLAQKAGWQASGNPACLLLQRKY